MCIADMGGLLVALFSWCEGSDKRHKDDSYYDPLQDVLDDVIIKAATSQPLLHISDQEEVQRGQTQQLKGLFKVLVDLGGKPILHCTGSMDMQLGDSSCRLHGEAQIISRILWTVLQDTP